MKPRAILHLVPVILLVGATSSCKRKNPDLAPSEAQEFGLPTDSTDFTGTDLVNEIPLEERPGGGMEVAAQLQPVYFGFDSSSIPPAEMAKIEAAAQLMLSDDVSVRIEGHTDEQGSREYNLALGERRALAVRDALIVLGADASKIHTLSLGEEQPAVAGEADQSLAENRRAEFVFFQ